MSTNKHAQIRYQALNKCFGNFNKRYYIEDLIYACNSALYEYSGITDGVKRRQIFDDIVYMESEAGWSIPLIRHKEGRKVFYRYENKEFSINNQPITETEANQLNDTLQMLSRFKGLPQFDWVEEMIVRIQSHFKLVPTNGNFVGFEHNPYLKGMHNFSTLFNAIKNSTVLEVSYQGFNDPEPISVVIHPYYLKQYNNRWFLLGFNGTKRKTTNLAIDRILEIKELNLQYINNNIDFDEYFDDIIGVSVHPETKPEKIVIEINNDLWPYIESKPLHGSQTIINRNDGFTTITIMIQVNYELISTLLAYGAKIRIIEPNSLKNRFSEEVRNLFKIYF